MGYRPEKEQVVAELKDLLAGAQSIVLTDYRGLNVAQMTELRRLLREAGVEYRVTKNTLTRRAARELGLDGLEGFLCGPTAIAFGREDPVAPARVIADFARIQKALEVKGGMVGRKVINREQVTDLARLPSREELMAQVGRALRGPIVGLVRGLSAPLQGLALVLDAVRRQREQGEGVPAG